MRAPPESLSRPRRGRSASPWHYLQISRRWFPTAAAEHGEVLRERHRPRVRDAAVAAHHAVAGNDLLLHPEILAAVRDQLVDFFEGARVEQPRHALARGQLALVVLFLEALLAAAQLGQALALVEFLDWIHISRRCRGWPACPHPAP